MGKISIYPVFNRGLKSSDKLNKSGKALVYIRVIMNREQFHISLDNLYIQPNQWDFNRRKVKNHPLALDYNAEISQKISLLESYIAESSRQNTNITFQELREQIKPQPNEIIQLSFTQFIQNEIKTPSRRLDDATRKVHRIFFDRLCRFKPEISFKEINYRFLKDFEVFMRQEKRDGVKPVKSENTIGKQMGILKTFILLAIKEDLLEKNPFTKYGKLPSQEPDRTALSPEEVNRLENLTFISGHYALERIRDMYLFSVYVGMRYEDLVNFKQEYLTTQGDKMYLSFQPMKHDSRFVENAPLHELYEGKPMLLVLKHLPQNAPFVFPKLNNGYINRQLKDIAKMAKINKRVHLHQGRTTFITDMCHRASATVIKGLTGHAREETIEKHYIKNSPERRNKIIGEIKWK
jgi:integrase